MKTGKWSRVQKKEYEAIKTVLDAGLKRSTVAQLMKRSTTTVQFIANSKDYDDFKAITKEYYDSKKPESKNGPVVTTVPATQILTATPRPTVDFNYTVVLTKLDNIDDKLNKMAEQIDWIANNAVVKDKRRFF